MLGAATANKIASKQIRCRSVRKKIYQSSYDDDRIQLTDTGFKVYYVVNCPGAPYFYVRLNQHIVFRNLVLIFCERHHTGQRNMMDKDKTRWQIK